MAHFKLFGYIELQWLFTQVSICGPWAPATYYDILLLEELIMCIFSRSVPETLTLTAISHLVHGAVKVEEPVSDIFVTIR